MMLLHAQSVYVHVLVPWYERKCGSVYPDHQLAPPGKVAAPQWVLEVSREESGVLYET